MFKFFVLTVFAINSLCAMDVKWDCVQAWNDNDEYSLTYIIDRTWAFGIWLASSAYESGYLIQLTGGLGNYCGNIMQADRGDLVSEATIRHQPLANYFDHSWIDDEKIGGTHELRAKANSDFYLMFVVSDGIAGPNYAYGWVNLGVDRRGNLSLLGSAIDLDGGPMIVGGGSASPKPSGVLLLLLGMGALGLKRVESGKRKMESECRVLPMLRNDGALAVVCGRGTGAVVTRAGS